MKLVDEYFEDPYEWKCGENERNKYGMKMNNDKNNVDIWLKCEKLMKDKGKNYICTKKL